MVNISNSSAHNKEIRSVVVRPLLKLRKNKTTKKTLVGEPGVTENRGKAVAFPFFLS